MIEIIENFPSHVAAFRASGKVTGNDYDTVVNPEVARVYKEFGKIDYLMEIDTPLSSFSSGAWMKDALMGFVYLTEWHRVAIVCEKGAVKRFTNIFGKLIPGKYRGFTLDEMDTAKEWVSG